ncbi:hypothetical protein ABEX25_27485 [Paenibacillus thiaminolyticus]|uniref:hypothetical protein n=1 Tax=Paenibacillus thiaminolyticus TaxID=49283 RepID=UPI003D2BB4B5
MAKREIRKEVLENNEFICEKDAIELQEVAGAGITTSSWICGVISAAACMSTACTSDCNTKK